MYNTPGVYVEEISTLPPSVVEVSTAIPAFIGYTEKIPPSGAVARVSSFREFTDLFGGPSYARYTITTDATAGVLTAVRDTTTPQFLLYYALSHYFMNGGGSCYVVSAGTYTSHNPPKLADFYSTLGGAALDLLEQEDEPTLLVLTDAANLLSPGDYYTLCQQALAQCQKLANRFAIFDVVPNGGVAAGKNLDVQNFRDNLGTNLDRGAAYFPYLKTSLTWLYDSDTETGVTFKVVPAPADGKDKPSLDGKTLAAIKNSNAAVYNATKTLLAGQYVILPPSAAIAGIYASTDRDRGVWKAPANVSVSAVIGPVSKMTDSMQENLNVDPSGAGKSINVIRSFAGKGTLVWGARTLAGESNEWRYVPVRRLFIMIEESARRASAFAVFEPNDITTWLKVKGMIESFLYGLWERGALAGSTEAAAYFVKVGLGKTMTQLDVLQGRMIVEIGIAAVRPAEFIVLRFSHKMQEA